MKICSKCGKEKEFNCFHRSKQFDSGYYSSCKECRKGESKRFYEENKEVKKKQSNEYYYANKDTIQKQKNEYNIKKRKEDPKFLLTRRLRNRLYYALKQKFWKKDTKFANYIGCDLEFLKTHMESQFIDGMCWENQGEWHIDHIIPLVSANTEDELYALCHYTNLRPMWALDNIKKGTKLAA